MQRNGFETCESARRAEPLSSSSPLAWQTTSVISTTSKDDLVHAACLHPESSKLSKHLRTRRYSSNGLPSIGVRLVPVDFWGVPEIKNLKRQVILASWRPTGPRKLSRTASIKSKEARLSRPVTTNEVQNAQVVPGVQEA